MKVYPATKNTTSIIKFILQLEFSQIQELISAYREMLLFFTKYSFFFESSITVYQPLKSEYVPIDSKLSTQDPARDGGNWYGYCGNNPLCYVDLNGLETWRNSTLTRDEYNKNYQLQRQYSWEEVQQHFADNPNGIIYRYDTVSYSLGKSNKDFPNMEKPSAELAYGIAGLSKTIGTKIGSWIKNGFKSAFSAAIVDSGVQLSNMVKGNSTQFDSSELCNATAGGFVSGFVSSGISALPGGDSPNASMMLSNMVGGFSGSMSSQLLTNIQNGKSLSEGIGEAYIYGTAGGFMVGAMNLFGPQILPGNIGQILNDSLKNEIVSTAAGLVLEEKINETRKASDN